MLPRSVICPRCGKLGILTLRWVRSSHYCLIEIPHQKPQRLKKQITNPVVGKDQEPTKLEDRFRHTYGPFWHLYIGHYDAEKYKEAMKEYRAGRLKSRPNGRRWCKVRDNAVKGGEKEAQSDLETLMAKYNFSLLDIINEIDERREDIRLKQGIF
jgi:hypothetical protein